MNLADIPMERYAGDVARMQALLMLVAAGQLPPMPDPAKPIGYTKSGRPIYPMSGGDDASLEAKLDELTKAIREQGQARIEAAPTGKAADGARYAAALDGSKAIADDMAELAQLRAEKAGVAAKAERKAEIDAGIKEYLSSQTGRSKAAQIGDGGATPGGRRNASAMKASAVQEAIFGAGYVSGEALSAIAAYTGGLGSGIDLEGIAAGKAKLQELGMLYLEAPVVGGMSSAPVEGKATLGATGATGGYVLPNNLVDGVVKPKTQRAAYRDLITIVPGVMVRGIDQPYRMGAPTRMVTADWGATKENVNEAYGTYTANLVTFARIYDIGKQYLRFSAGSAERDVLDELAKAADLAENFEVIAGPGSGSVGSGDACLGIYTSLNATPAFIGYKAAKTGAASSSTVAGAFAQACVELMQILAGRNRHPSAIVVDHTTYFTALGQGSDTAGFWAAPDGPTQGFAVDRQTGGITYFGTPVFYDTNLGTNAATKIAIAAEWDAFKLYRGMEFRIDSSDQAGTRWDQNLVGFRGEMEMGINAETGVHVGAAQLMTAVIP